MKRMKYYIDYVDKKQISNTQLVLQQKLNVGRSFERMKNTFI